MVPDNPLGCKKIVRNAYEYTAKSCRRENRIDYIMELSKYICIKEGGVRLDLYYNILNLYKWSPLLCGFPL